jgi:hypothetical protein
MVQNFIFCNIKIEIQGDFESCADTLITSYWLHVELGKKYLKNSMSKNNSYLHN